MMYLKADFADKCNDKYAIFITFDFNEHYLEIMRRIGGRVWHYETKTWEVPYSAYSILINNLNSNQIPYNAQEFMQSIQELSSKVEQMQIIQQQEANVDISILDKVDFKTTPFHYQKEGIAYGITHDKFLNADDQGLGKALALDTLVLTPNGWMPIVLLNVGASVFDETGKPCTITNIYDHNSKEMYLVKFNDGTEVTCCDEHLWALYDENGKRVTKQLKEILKDYKKYSLPICKAPQLPQTTLPIHPYVVGALIDNISSKYSLLTESKPLINKINRLLPKGVRLKLRNNNTKEYVLTDEAGTDKPCEIYCKNKPIPDEYLFTDVKSRVQLLQGLMDTHGRYDKEGNYVYELQNTHIYRSILALIRSLGGIGKYKAKMIKSKLSEYLIFNLPKNIKAFSNNKDEAPKNLVLPTRKIEKIHHIGLDAARCITVDSPKHTFIIKDFIVTHNTLQSIYTATTKKGGKHCLIVVGYSSLLFNWVKEIRMHTDEDAYVIGQRQNKRTGRWKSGKMTNRNYDVEHLNERKEFFLITDVTTLRQAIKKTYIDRKTGKEKTSRKEFFDYPFANALEYWCKQGEIGRIIVDEFQVCKNWDSLQTQALLKLKSCPYKIAATGTPIMNRNIDLYPLLVWLGEEHRDYWSFRDRYCQLGGFKGKQILGDKNNGELNSRLSKLMIRRKKENVLDLPEKIIIDELLELDGKQYALYQKAQRLAHKMKEEAKGNKVMLFAATLALRKITTYPDWDEPTGAESVKFERALQIVYEAYENKRKTIIFSNWTTPIMALHGMLTEYNPALIIGETKDRMEQVNKFQEDPNCHVILGTIGAMGTGLTLNKASNVIFLDEPWNRALKDQATDRAYRIGTKNNVNVYTLICRDSVDEGIHKLVYKKGRIADEIVDGVTVDELEGLLGNS